MPKAKKLIAEKVAKAKSLKPTKTDKPAKEKKDKKKDKAPKAAPVVVPPAPVKKPVVIEKPKKIVAPEVAFTTEEISLRAYFIAERRQAMGWAGDSSQDWVEAELQLKAEAKKKAQKK